MLKTLPTNSGDTGSILEKAMAAHSSTLAWKIPWAESPWGRKESDVTERFHFHFSLSCIGEGNGNPLQYSRLENPRDRGAWWAAVYGVAQSRTRLKQLSSSNSSVFMAINFFNWAFIVLLAYWPEIVTVCVCVWDQYVGIVRCSHVLII